MIARHSSVARNRWISPRQIQILQTLWSAKLRRAGRRLGPETSREERLRLIAEIVGHAVASSKELSWREANRVIHRLLEEIRSAELSPAAIVAAGPEAGAEPESQPLAPSPSGPSEAQLCPSEAQLWKIRQIEQYLGWGQPGKNEKRLAGFLRAKFHVSQPEELPHDQAWRAIEALCAAGARSRIKARKGQAYRVKRDELTRAVAALKRKLEDWRPEQP